MSGFPPVPVYPNEIDSDYTLFLVYNTSESQTSLDTEAFADEIPVRPRKASQAEIWADNGYANISGELFYYDAVQKNSGGKVCRLKRCVRQIGGRSSQFNPLGTWVRGFVIAEHHNQLVDTTILVEQFVGNNFSDDITTLDWRIRHLADSPILMDNICPDVQFTYEVVSTSPVTGTLVRYNLNITGNASFNLQFGDGQQTNSQKQGTHQYAVGANIDPIVILTSSSCQTVQSPVISNSPILTVVNATTFSPPFVISIPTCPVIPPIIISEFVITGPFPSVVFPSIVFPSIVFPSIVFPSIIFPSIIFPTILPSTISIIGPDLPSRITIDSPNIPSNITFTSPTFPVITFATPPTFPAITFGTPPTLPEIMFGPAPTISDINFEPAPSIPPVTFGTPPTFSSITFGPVPGISTIMSVSLINPCCPSSSSSSSSGCVIGCATATTCDGTTSAPLCCVFCCSVVEPDQDWASWDVISGNEYEFTLSNGVGSGTWTLYEGTCDGLITLTSGTSTTVFEDFFFTATSDFVFFEYVGGAESLNYCVSLCNVPSSSSSSSSSSSASSSSPDECTGWYCDTSDGSVVYLANCDEVNVWFPL